MSVIIHLIRHAESEANAGGTVAGWTDAPLTARGRAQAAALREVVRPDEYSGVWSSDLSRARDTANIAGFDPIEDPRCRELNFGDLEGEAWNVVLNGYADRFVDFENYGAPGGENMAQMTSRVLEFLDELSPGRHVVFCHGGVVRVVLARLGEQRMVANCALVEVDWSAQRLLAMDGMSSSDPSRS